MDKVVVTKWALCGGGPAFRVQTVNILPWEKYQREAVMYNELTSIAILLKAGDVDSLLEVFGSTIFPRLQSQIGDLKKAQVSRRQALLICSI